MTEFTPASALAGGALIGLASVLLFAFFGRIAGISGIAARLLPPYTDGEIQGRAAFILGLIAAPLLLLLLGGELPVMTIEAGPMRLLLAGALVGFGAVYGNGCTSGHGVCGLSRLSKRSFVAVAVFMATAIATVSVTRPLIGG
ncbi:MAG: YeeE/YedE family protein [Elstera sp.]